jgi:hypothetical protein
MDTVGEKLIVRTLTLQHALLTTSLKQSSEYGFGI